MAIHTDTLDGLRKRPNVPNILRRPYLQVIFTDDQTHDAV